MLSALTMGVIGLAATWVGLRGVLRARKVAAHTPNAAMDYPVRLPWLNNRTTAASTVLRVGQLYATAGVLMCVLGVGAWLTVRSNERPPACAELASSLLRTANQELALTIKEHSNSKLECVHAIQTDKGVTWFQIESVSNANPIGEQFNSKVQDMKRSGMATEPVPNGFRRAVVGTPGDDNHTHTTIVIEDSRGLHTVAVYPPALELQHLSTILQNLQHWAPNDP